MRPTGVCRLPPSGGEYREADATSGPVVPWLDLRFGLRSPGQNGLVIQNRASTVSPVAAWLQLISYWAGGLTSPLKDAWVPTHMAI